MLVKRVPILTEPRKLKGGGKKVIFRIHRNGSVFEDYVQRNRRRKIYLYLLIEIQNTTKVIRISIQNGITSMNKGVVNLLKAKTNWITDECQTNQVQNENRLLGTLEKRMG